jgi:hypothetical protein
VKPGRLDQKEQMDLLVHLVKQERLDRQVFKEFQVHREQ